MPRSCSGWRGRPEKSGMLNCRSATRRSCSPKSVGGATGGIFLYVKYVDSAFNKAVSAGAKVEMALADQFWGDRYGKLSDPFGHSWSLATHKEDVAPEEMKKRMQVAMAKMSEKAKTAI